MQTSQAQFYIFLFIVICSGIGGWYAHSSLAGDFRTYDLGDGRHIVLLRNIEQAYPVYGKTVKAELDVALSQKKEILDTTAKGKFGEEAKQLYEGLDVINIDVRTSLISAYSGLVLRISSSKEPTAVAEAFKKWDEILELVIQQAFKIRTINSQLAAVRKSTSSGEWEKLFALGREAVQYATQLKSQVDKQGR